MKKLTEREKCLRAALRWQAKLEDCLKTHNLKKGIYCQKKMMFYVDQLAFVFIDELPF